MHARAVQQRGLATPTTAQHVAPSAHQPERMCVHVPGPLARRREQARVNAYDAACARAGSLQDRGEALVLASLQELLVLAHLDLPRLPVNTCVQTRV